METITNLSTGEQCTLKEGDIIKKELTSRQSWTMKLMAVPNTNRFFTDTEPIEWREDCHIIAHIGNLDFSSTGRSRPYQDLYNRCDALDETLKMSELTIVQAAHPEKIERFFDHFKRKENGR